MEKIGRPGPDLSGSLPESAHARGARGCSGGAESGDSVNWQVGDLPHVDSRSDDFEGFIGFWGCSTHVLLAFELGLLLPLELGFVFSNGAKAPRGGLGEFRRNFKAKKFAQAPFPLGRGHFLGREDFVAVGPAPLAATVFKGVLLVFTVQFEAFSGDAKVVGGVIATAEFGEVGAHAVQLVHVEAVRGGVGLQLAGSQGESTGNPRGEVIGEAAFSDGGAELLGLGHDVSDFGEPSLGVGVGGLCWWCWRWCRSFCWRRVLFRCRRSFRRGRRPWWRWGCWRFFFSGLFHGGLSGDEDEGYAMIDGGG